MGQRDLNTLVVGLDAACQGVLERVGDDAVPTIRTLVAQGASAPLRSQVPPWTPSAWPSIYTGMNPGKHGVFDFLSFDGYDYSVVDASHVRERPVWELLDRHGYASVVVNAPVTHPPSEFDGALVPGYVGPESPTCHPAGLLEDVEEAVGEYRVYPEETGDATGYVDAIRTRGEAFRYLAERFDPEFGFLQFQATDTVFHDRPGDWDAVRAVYRAVDEQIGAVLDACDPDTVLVVSDHGMARLDGVAFRVNDFLADRGDLESTRAGAGMPTWSTVREQQLKTGTAAEDANGNGTSPDTFVQRAGSLAARAGVTSQRVGRALDAVGLADPVARALPSGLVHAGAEQVDFPASRAFMRSRTECGVRINLAGREPAGTVPPSEYERVRSELIDAFRSVTAPDGEALFERVLPREAVFEGPCTERGPDVVLVPSGFDHFLSAELRGSTFGEPAEPYNHAMDGLVVASGDGVNPERPLGSPSLFDVAPTVLATFDLPADDRMDGSCLPVVESAGQKSYPRPDPGARNDTGAPGVQQRLADMGYIE